MKRTQWIMIAIMAVSLAGITMTVSGCKDKDSTQVQSPAGTNTVQYTCPMHPEVVQNTPGKCPKCGMDLVEKK